MFRVTGTLDLRAEVGSAPAMSDHEESESPKGEGEPLQFDRVERASAATDADPDPRRYQGRG